MDSLHCYYRYEDAAYGRPRTAGTAGGTDASDGGNPGDGARDDRQCGSGDAPGGVRLYYKTHRHAAVALDAAKCVRSAGNACRTREYAEAAARLRLPWAIAWNLTQDARDIPAH